MFCRALLAKPVIEGIFALEDMATAQAMPDRRQVFGKLLLDPTCAG